MKLQIKFLAIAALLLNAFYATTAMAGEYEDQVKAHLLGTWSGTFHILDKNSTVVEKYPPVEVIVKIDELTIENLHSIYKVKGTMTLRFNDQEVTSALSRIGISVARTAGIPSPERAWLTICANPGGSPTVEIETLEPGLLNASYRMELYAYEYDLFGYEGTLKKN